MKPNKVIRIFVSSTFKDMDAERDAIKFKVIPMLNQKYRLHGLEIQVVDLRIGVNTTGLSEEWQENKVLEVCLDNIDCSRPFFIGLLGERYGWIPPSKRFEHIFAQLSKVHKPLISGMHDRSVTELEILYGAIGENGKYIDNALFFFRDKESYRTMPLNIYEQFTEESQDKQNKLRDLKQRINRIASNTPAAHPVEYHLEWDKDKNMLSGGIDDFIKLVSTRLDLLISSSLENKEFNFEWWERWVANDQALINTYSNSASGLKSQVAELASRLLSGERIVCSSSPGFGKSTVLALVCNYLKKNNDIIVLTVFIGSEYYALSPKGILTRWINEISVVTGNEAPFKSYEDAFEYELPILVNRLSALINDCRIKTVILIDDFDGLENSNGLSYLNWIPVNVPFLASSVYDSPYVLRIDNSLCHLSLSYFQESDKQSIISGWEIRHSNDLGNDVRKLLKRVASSPRRLSLLLKLIQHFSTEDFMSIRNLKKDTEMAKITEYVYKTIEEAPIENDGLICHVTDRITRYFKNPSAIRSMFSMIALSPSGLNDREIEWLGGKGFDLLDFKIAVYNLSDFFYIDINSQRLRFRSKVLSDCISMNDKNHDKLYRHLLDYSLSLPDYESYKQENCLYYCIKSKNIETIKAKFLYDPGDSDSKLQATNFYRSSINHLLTLSSASIQEIRECGLKLNDKDRIIFYYNICYMGLTELIPRLHLLCELIDELLAIDAEELDSASVSYALGWMLSDCHLHASRNKSEPIDRLLTVLDHSLKAYDHCRDLKSDYKDVKNMIVALNSQLIPLYAKSGDFASMERIINKLTLNN